MSTSRKFRDSIHAKGTDIAVLSNGNSDDYISLTDIARYKSDAPDDVIKNWMRNRDTIEFLGLWEQLNNPEFKPVEFDGFRTQAGSNAFTMSPKKWIDGTGAVGIISKAGRYGGTFAQKDIAFEFASWISAEFKLYIIKCVNMGADGYILKPVCAGVEFKPDTGENQLPYPYGCHQGCVDPAGCDPTASELYLRQ